MPKRRWLSGHFCATKLTLLWTHCSHVCAGVGADNTELFCTTCTHFIALFSDELIAHESRSRALTLHFQKVVSLLWLDVSWINVYPSSLQSLTSLRVVCHKLCCQICWLEGCTHSQWNIQTLPCSVSIVNNCSLVQTSVTNQFQAGF